MIKNNVSKLKTIPVEEFLTYEFNTLKDPKRDVTHLVNSIKKHGWSFPVFIWKNHNYVIDGAGRKLAVEKLLDEGVEVKDIPVVEIEATDLEDAKNKVLEVSSSYGEVTRHSFVEFTKDIEIDFDTFEIDGIDKDMFLEADDKDDEVPEPPTEPQSKIGDLYVLGNHRVLCGDSTKLEDVERLMDGKKADMVFTDPPYGVNYEGIKNDSREGLESLLTDSMQLVVSHSKSGASAYVFHSDRCADIFHKVFRTYFHFSSMIIWEKPSLVLSQTDYQSKHEPCLYGWVDNGTHQFFGDRKQVSVWRTDKEPRIQGHTTPKPVEIVMRAIGNSSKSEDIVIDPFLGSGSTLIAAEKTSRVCYGVELDPRYVDVIVKRYCDYTGNNKVTRVRDGLTEELIWQTK